MRPPELRFEDPKFPPIVMWEEHIVIGRDAGCDRVVDHEKMSKRHAEIRQRGKNWFLRDLGSTNGTALNGADCSEEQQLVDGARIKIGGLFARFELTEAPPAPTPTSTGTAGGEESGPPAAESPSAAVGGGSRERLRWRRTQRQIMQLTVSIAMLMICGTIVLVAVKALDDVAEKANQANREAQRAMASRDSGSGAPQERTVADPAVRSEGPGRRVDEDDFDLSQIPPEYRGRFNRDRREAVDRMIDEYQNRGGRRDVGNGEENVAIPPLESYEDSEGSTTEVRRVPDPGPVRETTPREKPRSELTRALETKDAGVIAQLLDSEPNAPEAGAARDLLRGQTVYCFTRSGGFGDIGDEIFFGRFPIFHCAPDDRDAVVELGLSITLLDRKLRIRYETDYDKGLGPAVGKTRLAPHPKKVVIEVFEIRADDKRKRICKVEGDTPFVAAEKFPPGGLSESEVWRLTLEPLAAKLGDALE